MRFALPVVLLGWLCVDVLAVIGDIGTATSYDPPYTPTKCSGNNPDQFPEGGMFVAASNGLWDNGAACGRRYRMRCISGPKRPCKDGSMIVEVVDVCRTNPCPTTFLLSNRAFNAISRNPSLFSCLQDLTWWKLLTCRTMFFAIISLRIYMLKGFNTKISWFLFVRKSILYKLGI